MHLTVAVARAEIDAQRTFISGSTRNGRSPGGSHYARRFGGFGGADDRDRYASHFVAASVAASNAASPCAIPSGFVGTPWRPLITFVHSDVL